MGTEFQDFKSKTYMDTSMNCLEWTPLAAAAAAGELDAVNVLLQGRADPNLVCRCCAYGYTLRHYSPLDCARTGGAWPTEQNPYSGSRTGDVDDNHEIAIAKYPAIEQALLRAG